MNWITLNDIAQLDELAEVSHQKPVMIFKHSTRCPISAMVLQRLERSWDESEMEATEIYFLDLITYRSVSNEVASKFGVPHQSPQVLVIKSGKSAFDASHTGIAYKAIKQEVAG